MRKLIVHVAAALLIGMLSPSARADGVKYTTVGGAGAAVNCDNGPCVDKLLDLPALDCQEDADGRVIMDLPALKLVGGGVKAPATAAQTLSWKATITLMLTGTGACPGDAAGGQVSELSGSIDASLTQTTFTADYQFTAQVTATDAGPVLVIVGESTNARLTMRISLGIPTPDANGSVRPVVEATLDLFPK